MLSSFNSNLRKYLNIPKIKRHQNTSPKLRDFLKYSKKFSQFVGFWPESGIFNFRQNIRFVVSLTLILCTVTAQTYYAFQHLDDLIEFFEGITPALSLSISVLKQICVVFERKSFSKIIKKLKKYSRYDGKFGLKIVRRQEQAEKLGLYFGVLAHSLALFYILRPLSGKLLCYISGTEFIREFPFRTSFPFDATKSPIYEIFYCLISYSGMINASATIAVDLFVLSVFMYIGPWFEIVRSEIERLIPYEAGRAISPAQNRIIERKLKKMIALQTHLIEFTNDIMSTFTLIIMLHFLSATLVIAFSSINLLVVEGFALVIYVVYVQAALFQLFIYCFGGSYLTDSSFNISTAIYFTEWYRLDIKNQKIVLLMLMRSSIELKADVPFFTLSLETFSVLVQTAGSYITLVKSFF